MARKTKTQGDPVEAVREPASSLTSPAGQAWLQEQYAEARREMELGPGGNGWLYNEGLREEIEERVEFLRSLIGLLPVDEE